MVGNDGDTSAPGRVMLRRDTVRMGWVVVGREMLCEVVSVLLQQRILRSLVTLTRLARALSRDTRMKYNYELLLIESENARRMRL